MAVGCSRFPPPPLHHRRFFPSHKKFNLKRPLLRLFWRSNQPPPIPSFHLVLALSFFNSPLSFPFFWSRARLPSIVSSSLFDSGGAHSLLPNNTFSPAQSAAAGDDGVQPASNQPITQFGSGGNLRCCHQDRLLPSRLFAAASDDALHPPTTRFSPIAPLPFSRLLVYPTLWVVYAIATHSLFLSNMMMRKFQIPLSPSILLQFIPIRCSFMLQFQII